MGKGWQYTFLQRCYRNANKLWMILSVSNYHRNTPIRMATSKDINEHWWECGDVRTYAHCWWDYKMVPPLWETVWKFKIIKNKMTIWWAITLLGMSREWKGGSQTDICTPLFLTALLVRAKRWLWSKCPSNRWPGKQKVVYTYKGVLFTLENEGNPVKCYMWIWSLRALCQAK